MSWVKLERLRKKAREESLKILIWGAGKDDPEGFAVRERLCHELCEKKHKAALSENLVQQGSALPDPLQDELLQANAADLVIALYGARGVQTEIDKIGSLPGICRKLLICIERDTLHQIESSVSSQHWEHLKSNGAKIFEYGGAVDSKADFSTLHELIEMLRIARYIQKLTHKLAG